MLPLHRLAAQADGPKSTFQIGRFARRPARWFVLAGVLATSLWILGSFILHLQVGPRLPLTPNGRPPLKNVPPPQATIAPPSIWDARANQVRGAYLHAYSGYKKYAASYDELLPISGGKVNNFNGWGVSLFDSLDTMWIMGLRDEFFAAMRIVTKQKFKLKLHEHAPFFETTIRYLGGLLSAYALSGEPILLARADDLGRMLLPAFNTSSGLPRYAVNLQTGRTMTGWKGDLVIWSEATSCQLEFKYLAKMTGRAEYFETVENVMKKMYAADVADGLFATEWTQSGLPFGGHFSVGASADSGYEYLLKQYLLSGKTESKARDQYIKSADGIINNLLYLTPNRKLLYVTDTRNGKPSHIFEHLSCFLPGLLALGAHTLDLPAPEKELHLWAARGLAYTCWISYSDQASGLGPDQMRMADGGKWMDHVKAWEAEGRVGGGVPPGIEEVPQADDAPRDYSNAQSIYLLRPETVESFYILWRTTGDSVWRDRGWAVFEAIEKGARTQHGYASLAAVDKAPPHQNDDMPSYFLAETLKYLYLLFSDSNPIPLDKWVFNTEAHPLPIFNWNDWEKEEYGIA